MTGRELVRFCAAVRGVAGLGSAVRLAERFDADLDRPTGELSRGNRQKVGLVQALFHDPELLVLDEPTSGLDPLMQEEFLAVVGERAIGVGRSSSRPTTSMRSSAAATGSRSSARGGWPPSSTSLLSGAARSTTSPSTSRSRVP